MECEIPEFYSTSTPRARKAHVCCECGSDIFKGEKHFQATGKWDGAISSYRQHLICERACEFIRDHIDYECIGYGTLFEYCGGVDYFKHYKKELKYRTFRHLIARIRWREREQTY